MAIALTVRKPSPPGRSRAGREVDEIDTDPHERARSSSKLGSEAVTGSATKVEPRKPVLVKPGIAQTLLGFDAAPCALAHRYSKTLRDSLRKFRRELGQLRSTANKRASSWLSAARLKSRILKSNTNPRRYSDETPHLGPANAVRNPCDAAVVQRIATPASKTADGSGTSKPALPR